MQILRELDHPNVVKIHQFFRSDLAYYYAVLDLLAGEELFDYIAKKVGGTAALCPGSLCFILLEKNEFGSFLHPAYCRGREKATPTLSLTSPAALSQPNAAPA